MRGSPRIWLALGWVVLVILGVFVGVFPRLRALDRLDQEASSLSGQASRSDAGASKLAQLNERLARARATVQTRVRPIPHDADVAGLIRTLTTELDDLGMTEREITTGAPKDIGDAMSAPMSVRMTGPFLGVYQAVRWIETLPRLVRITRVTIKTPQRNPEELIQNAGRMVHAELLLNVYSDPAPTESTGASASAESPSDRRDDP